MPKYDNIDEAAKNGDINMVKYLHLRGIKHNRDIIFDVINNNHLDMVKYLYNIDKKYRGYDDVEDYIYLRNAIDTAVMVDNIDIYKFLSSSVSNENDNILFRPPKAYDIRILKKATNNGNFKIYNHIQHIKRREGMYVGMLLTAIPIVLLGGVVYLS